MTTHLIGPITTPLTTGGAGASTANVDTTTIIRGRVTGVYLQYGGSPPAGTTDVVLKTKGTSPRAPSYTLLSVANAATSGWFWPQVQICTTAGAAIAGEYTPQIVDDILNLAIAQADDNDYVTAWLMIEEV